jgi:hypothetical protein
MITLVITTATVFAISQTAFGAQVLTVTKSSSSLVNSLGTSDIKGVWITHQKKPFQVGISGTLDKDGQQHVYSFNFSNYADAAAFAQQALDPKIESITCQLIGEDTVSNFNNCLPIQVILKSGVEQK